MDFDQESPGSTSSSGSAELDSVWKPGLEALIDEYDQYERNVARLQAPVDKETENLDHRVRDALLDAYQRGLEQRNSRHALAQRLRVHDLGDNDEAIGAYRKVARLLSAENWQHYLASHRALMKLEDRVHAAQRSSPSEGSTGAETKPKPKPKNFRLDRLDGVELLTAEERDLCTLIRLEPKTYLNIKAVFTREDQNLGGTLRLRRARQLIRIDVNKTRRIYDFLVDRGLIAQTKPNKDRQRGK
eukprot:Clim_evm58s207 gene=Clim_evmTU58s207